eukprot:278381-Chlamydomonas_euryale.AAC.16
MGRWMGEGRASRWDLCRAPHFCEWRNATSTSYGTGIPTSHAGAVAAVMAMRMNCDGHAYEL